MRTFIASLQVALATILVSVVGYTLIILGVAQVTPETAEGSLVRRPDGTVIGSRLIAQKFENPRYVWPRPSAPDYNASGAAGSNKSPTSVDLAKRAQELVIRYGATADNPLPADLAAASGSGLDPHTSLRAALYQVDRVAKARGVAPGTVEAVLRASAFSPGGALTPDSLVNVLEVNLALDRGASAVAVR